MPLRKLAPVSARILRASQSDRLPERSPPFPIRSSPLAHTCHPDRRPAPFAGRSGGTRSFFLLRSPRLRPSALSFLPSFRLPITDHQ